MLKQILQGPLFLIAAILLGIIVIPIGLIYSIAKCFYRANIKGIILNFKNLILGILLTISYICEKIAVGIDILGNVASGELIEDCVTTVENTLYGKPGITLSSATGELEIKENKFKNKVYLNDLGVKFTNLLGKVFEDNHSILSYKYYILNQKIIEETKQMQDNDDYQWVPKN